MGIDQIASASAVFLDRDGVLNRNVFNPATGEYESPGKPEDFQLAPGAMAALHILKQSGFLLFLVSNQPNVAKGKSTLAELHSVHERLESALRQAGVAFSEYFYCFHHPNGIIPPYLGPCECRKPSPYFLKLAGAKYSLSLASSWMVGDRATDIECGKAAGVRTIRVKEDHPAKTVASEIEADFWAEDLAQAVEIITAHTA